MAARCFGNVVHEVLAEAERSLLVEHERLLQALGRGNEECVDPLWLSNQFVDDTEEEQLVSGQDRKRKELWHNEQKASDVPFTNPRAAVSTCDQAPLQRVSAVHAEAVKRLYADDGKDGCNADLPSDMSEADVSIPVSRPSVVSFGGFDFQTWGLSEGSDGEFLSEGEHLKRNSTTDSEIRRQSLCLSRGMTVQEVIELGGMGRQQEQDYSFRDRIYFDRAFQNSLCETFIATVVVVNIALIGVSCDYGVGWVGWTVLDAVFALIFTTECILKLYFLGVREFCAGRDFFWNIFEALLAVFATFEVALALMRTATDTRLSMLRVVRLARLARVIRICRLEAFSDLMMMINGAVGGTKTLLWSIVLISLPLYAVALLLRETLGAAHLTWLLDQSSEDLTPSLNASTSAAFADVLSAATGTTSTSSAAASEIFGGTTTEDVHAVADARAAQVAAEAFSSLPWAFFNVFRCIVGQDCTSKDGKPLFVHVARAYGWGYGLIYCVTMLLMTFGLFNVIVAIYVENTVAAAKCNSIIMKQHRLNNSQLVAEKLHELMEIICDIHEDRKRAGARGIGSMSSGEDSTPKESLTLSDDFDPEARKGKTLEESFEITPKFMDILKDEPRVLEILRALDIDDADIRDLFDTLDVDGSGTIDVQEMIQGLMKLRGDASRSDVVGVKLVCRSIQAEVAQMKDRFRLLLVAQQEQVDQLAAISAFVNSGAPPANGGRRSVLKGRGGKNSAC